MTEREQHLFDLGESIKKAAEEAKEDHTELIIQLTAEELSDLLTYSIGIPQYRYVDAKIRDGELRLHISSKLV